MFFFEILFSMILGFFDACLFGGGFVIGGWVASRWIEQRAMDTAFRMPVWAR